MHTHTHTHIHTGMDIVRKRFAILDIADNYSFSFASNLRDEDLYPGKVISSILIEL